jgi:hypothetical protein
MTVSNGSLNVRAIWSGTIPQQSGWLKAGRENAVLIPEMYTHTPKYNADVTFFQRVVLREVF